MADKYLIAAGGTGALCASAFIHMAAAGCAEQNTVYHVLLIDKDKQSDAMTSCQNLLSNYNDLRRQMGKKADTLTFPEIRIHTWNFTDEILDEYQKQTGKSLSNLDNLTLQELLNSGKDPTVQQLLDTMYSPEELATNLEKGFYGHPNIGAPVFDYVRDRFLAPSVDRANGTKANNTFMQSLIATLQKDKAYVYLLGSLFGGTGATVIPNVVLALRTLKNGTINLVLGAAVLMPYFRLPVCPSDSVEAVAKVSPSDSKFEKQTKEALYYYEESDLLGKMMNLMLIGTAELDVTSEMYARGGSQTQHFHMVHMLAATSANRFFANQLGKMKGNITENVPTSPLGELLVWKIDPQTNGGFKTLTRSELGLTDEHDKMMHFLRFSVVVAYYMALKFSQKCEIVKNSVEVLGTYKQLSDANGNPLNLKWDQVGDSIISDYYQVPVEKAGAICRDFITFLRDIALSGYDWSKYREMVKTSESQEVNGKTYYRYEQGSVNPQAAAGFMSRWVDLANLGGLEMLLQDATPQRVVDSITLNELCSFNMADSQRAPYTETKYPKNIGIVYTDKTLHDLGLYTHWGRIKNDRVDFSQIYDQLYKVC